MENKINIAELLTDCPRGMELDCALFEGVYLKGIIDDEDIDYPILIRTKEGETWNITSEGCWDDSPSAKCIIFPKGKTTWEGFVPPCKFKDGDIIFTHTNSSKCNLDNCWVSIFKEYRNNRCACYVCLCLSGLELYHDKWEDELLCELCEIEENRLASEEEKEKLFQAIKDNGYKWNAETKTLEKLVEPKFKVGDNIRIKGTSAIYVVTEIREDRYMLDDKDILLRFINQDQWELVPNKFDINTLIPFESRVLVRDNNTGIWRGSFWGCLNSELDYKYDTIRGSYKQCIPYEGNEHLLGKTDNCNDFYKTW